MFNPSGNYTPSNSKQMSKSGAKSGQKWTVVGDLNNFLAHTSGWVGEEEAVDRSTSNAADSSHYREAGIIEKLLPSYGFIQCCERQARLFFHYSQFNGKIEHLHVGDAVEFEMTYDKRTGKPIASFVVKISSEAIGEESAVERVTGFITTELCADKEGRVAYENRGECFFLPFGKDDLDEPSHELRSKDRVNFLITKDKNGNPRARHVALETPSPQRFRGVVCTIKDSFGFIERADQVREIFFHASECVQFKQLQENDSVEFSVQERNKKEVATSVDLLERGTAQFEKFIEEGCIGQVLEPIDHNNLHPQLANAYNSYSLLKSNGYEPFAGKIFYRKNGEEIEIPLGYREVKYTLQIGDWVRFKIVLDTRDQQKYAADVTFMDETLKYSGEKRLQGQVVDFVADKGFIKGPNNTLYVFSEDEIINPKVQLEHRQMVEFTPVDPSKYGGMPSMAIRVIACPAGFDGLGSNSAASGTSHQLKGFVSELSDATCTGLIRLFEPVADCPDQVEFSFADIVSGGLPFVNDRVDVKLEPCDENGWKSSEIRILKSQIAMDDVNASSLDMSSVQFIPHCGNIRVLSRYKGILHSNLLPGKDIFFKVADLPAQLFSTECVFDFYVDSDNDGLRAYDIRISNEVSDCTGNGYGHSQPGGPEFFCQKLRGKVEQLSRGGGYLNSAGNRFYFQMCDFPILMVDLSIDFDFVVSAELGLSDLWRAIELNPASNQLIESNGYDRTPVKRQKGFVARVKKFGGLVQSVGRNRNRYPFVFESMLDPNNTINFNDEVEFEVEQRDGRPTAVRLQLIQSRLKEESKTNGKRNDNEYSLENVKGKSSSSKGQVQRGFVAAVKESYGFIEGEFFDQEIFFHFR
jgi:cold shock CspA family protein